MGWIRDDTHDFCRYLFRSAEEDLTYRIFLSKVTRSSALSNHHLIGAFQKRIDITFDHFESKELEEVGVGHQRVLLGKALLAKTHGHCTPETEAHHLGYRWNFFLHGF